MGRSGIEYVMKERIEMEPWALIFHSGRIFCSPYERDSEMLINIGDGPTHEDFPSLLLNK